MTIITVERTDSAYSQAVPESAWRVAGQARTWRGLDRICSRLRPFLFPQPGSWAGHIRYRAENGTVLDYGTAMRLLGCPEDRLPARWQ